MGCGGERVCRVGGEEVGGGCGGWGEAAVGGGRGCRWVVEEKKFGV